MLQEELYSTFTSQEEDDISDEETPSDEEVPSEEGLDDEEV